MTRLCLLAKPWRHVALLDYLPLELRQQRNGSQQDIIEGLRALGIGSERALRGTATARQDISRQGNTVAVSPSPGGGR